MSEHEHNKKVHKCQFEGKNYDNPQLEELAKETADIIKKQKIIELNKDSLVLDFGAGTGLIGLNFINQVKHVIFEDVSKDMLDYLKSKLDKLKVNNYTIFNDIIENYNSKEKIDLITAGMVLHHVDNLESIFSKFIQLLKPKGFLCITDLRKNAPMFDIGEHKHHNLTNRGFEPHELCKELKKVGFIMTEVIRISNIVHKRIKGNDIFSERFMIIAQGP